MIATLRRYIQYRVTLFAGTLSCKTVKQNKIQIRRTSVEPKTMTNKRANHSKKKKENGMEDNVIPCKAVQ